MVKVFKHFGLVVCAVLFTITLSTSAADNSAGTNKNNTSKSSPAVKKPIKKKPAKTKPATKKATAAATKPATAINPDVASGFDTNSLAKITNPFPKVATAYGVLTDQQWLWGQKVETPIPQASLTKMMTALLAVEHGQLEKFAVVSVNAAKAKPMKAKIRAGDRIKQRDLLTATLVASANDTCLALAEAIAGSETRFVVKMNVRAKELGLRQTHFENACGFDERGHQSTVRDLVVLTHYVMQKKVIADVVKLQTFLLPRVGKKAIKLKSTNALLRKEGNGVIGVKTGFTNRAGRCLVAMARRNGHEVTLVLLNARNRWWNADALINKAFAQIENNATGNAALAHDQVPSSLSGPGDSFTEEDDVDAETQVTGEVDPQTPSPADGAAQITPPLVKH